jgi:hypothetical protein
MTSPLQVFLALFTVFVACASGTLAHDRIKEPPEGLSLPQRGYWILLNKPLGVITLTATEYDNLWKVWPEPLRTRAEKATRRGRRALALTRYGFQESPERPAGAIPQQFTSDDKGGLVINCLACHGGKVSACATAT